MNGGLYVRSFTPAGLHFAGLRCFDDVAFGDNVELVWADSSALPVKTLECIAFAVPASQQVTFIQAVCKNWASVPANTNPKEWDETGHGGELNGAADTSLADPADIGSGCERSNGWKFTLAGSQNGEPFRSVGPTAPDGGSTESLTGEEIEALSNGGLWVRSVVKSGYQFAGLRCYDDVNYSDNLELIYIPGNETPKGGVYCIAFAVKHVSGEKLSPVLECVVDLGATSTNTAGRYVAIFGYNNPNSESMKIEVGSNNKFTPAPQQRGQPEEFQPGRQQSVFKVEFSGGNLVWTLNGKTSTASPNSARCSP